MAPTSLTVSRRRVLAGAAGLAAVGAVGSTPASAGQAAYGGWFTNTSNYEGTVDRRGESTVEIAVGAAGNGGNYAFSPAAVQVDPGTTLVWEWTGEGNSHDVVAKGGAFTSEMQSEAGATFEHTVEATGTYEYACRPHEAMGMKGVVVVGDLSEAATVGAEDAGVATDEPGYGDWFDKTENYEGTVDRTGEAEVTVAVGAAGNGGALAFDPPAVRVDPGATVVWEWTGDGSYHNVADDDDRFESELTDEDGFTFERTMTEAGVCKYACAPHEQMGMRGAIVVGDGGAEGRDESELFAVGGGVGMAGVLFALFLAGLGVTKPEKRKRPPSA